MLAVGALGVFEPRLMADQPFTAAELDDFIEQVRLCIGKTPFDDCPVYSTCDRCRTLVLAYLKAMQLPSNTATGKQRAFAPDSVEYSKTQKLLTRILRQWLPGAAGFGGDRDPVIRRIAAQQLVDNYTDYITATGNLLTFSTVARDARDQAAVVECIRGMVKIILTPAYGVPSNIITEAINTLAGLASDLNPERGIQQAARAASVQILAAAKPPDDAGESTEPALLPPPPSSLDSSWWLALAATVGVGAVLFYAFRERPASSELAGRWRVAIGPWAEGYDEVEADTATEAMSKVIARAKGLHHGEYEEVRAWEVGPGRRPATRTIQRMPRGVRR